MRRHLILTATLTFLLLLPVAGADDWPGWRGPHRDARSAETGLLREWPEGGPPLVWKTAGIGAGYSSLAVVTGRIYTLGDVGEDQMALALSAEDGRPLWRARLTGAFKDQFPGPRSTPTVGGGRVYAMTSDGTVVALAAEDGSVLWRVSLPGTFGGFVMQARAGFDWRFSESPLLDGDRLIVTPGTRDAGLAALDAETGKELWRTRLPEDLGEKGLDGAGYSSAVPSEAGGVRQYVQLLGRGLVGVEAETGRFLWSYNRLANRVANIPTPLVSADYVFSSTGYPSGGSALLKLRRDGEAFRAEEVYFLPPETLQNHHGQMVLHDGHVYLGEGLNRGFPVCVEMSTGRFVWGPLRNRGQNSAAVLFADGHLYLRYQNGRMILAEASPEGYREKGSFMIPEVSAPSWSHPVIANGRLYLREQGNLFVYDVSVP